MNNEVPERGAADKILILGSLAYDHMMRYRGVFKEASVPGSSSLSLTAFGRKLFYGGCAGNIAYSLQLLGEKPVIATAVGKDFREYRDRLEKLGIDLRGVVESVDLMTASAFIITDNDEDQITIFDPGAMHDEKALISLEDLKPEEIRLALLAPDLPLRMLSMGRECVEQGIPYYFDPGQQTGIFTVEELREIIDEATGLIMNEYEAELVCQKLKIDLEELVSRVTTVIVTKGEKGCTVWSSGKEFDVGAVKPRKLADPTGCGDAFRAGLLSGLMRDVGLKKACHMAAVVASFSLEHVGTQEHSFTKEEFEARAGRDIV